MSDTISQKLDRILSILENDEKTGRKGSVQKISDLENEVELLKTKDKITESKTALLGTIGGFLAMFIAWIFEHFIINKK
jgi:hypothetical protein